MTILVFLLLFLSSSEVLGGNGGIASILQAVVFNSNVSNECGVHVQEYHDILDQLNFTDDHMWALQMFDATAKIPEGILYGALTDFGNFDECLAVEHPTQQFTGQHCMINIDIKTSSILGKSLPRKIQNKAKGDIDFSTIPIFYGVCLPSSCTTDDLRILFDNDHLNGLANVTIKDENCWTKGHRQLSDGSWGFISFFIILAVLVLLSTIYETYTLFILLNVKPNRLLSSFSLYSNTKSMLEIRDSSGEMACLHGIRTLSMMWVVLGHTYESEIITPVSNAIEENQQLQSADDTFITNGLFSVDSFFVISGLLVAFVFFRNISKNGYFDVPVSYIHRYFRLTPTFMIMVVFNITLLTELNKGPLYSQQTGIEKNFCVDNWWSSLLYVQNYVNPLGTCLGQSWYLSADMQMYWISPLILYPLFFWPKFGAVCLGVLTLASAFWTFGLAYANNYKAIMFLNPDLVTQDIQFKNDYVATHPRMSPWLVGIVLGYIICVIKAKRITVRLSKTQVMVGWTLSAGICLGCLYGLRRFIDDENASVAEHTLYLSFARLGWGVGLAWVMFACIYGYGGLVNSFLSLGIFQPLGKLSYNVYLVHESILTYRRAIERTNSYYTDLYVVFDFLAVVVLAYLFSMFLYLLVELPVANFDKELLGSLKILPFPAQKKKPNENSQQINNKENA